MKEYGVQYTKLAEAFLGEFQSAFEEFLRGDLAKMLPDGYYPPNNFFHTVTYQDRDYLAVGKKDHILVDTATYEEDGEQLTAGPFKGKRVMMPRPDSEE